MYLRLALPGHQTFHPLDTLKEVNVSFFRGLLVQSSNDIVDGLVEGSWQTMTRSGMSEGILVVPSKRRPGWVLFRRWGQDQEGWRIAWGSILDVHWP
jgi:hypothetical protein